ncbi:MAG: T9SS type A sorting domain-containing protein, partial [Candidatus Cloacimonadaceae bacterium]|nr:T9SS type A sorting domain-containing protein [Candidatus Cloacimonadaceae bacterium]
NQTGTGTEYSVDLSGLEDGDFLQYYFSAADASGRSVSLPVMAPQVFYSTQISSTTTSLYDPLPAPAILALYPNPARAAVQLKASSLSHSHSSVHIYNLKGQLVHSQAISIPKGNSEHTISLPSHLFANGLYFISLEGKGFRTVRKLLVHK